MSYVEESLTKGEQIIHEGKVHWYVYTFSIIWFVLAAILQGTGIFTFLFCAGLLSLLWAFIYSKTTELAVTSKRVIAKQGLIARQTIDISLSKVEGVSFNQSVMGRIFKFGTLNVRGTGEGVAPIKYVADPMGFKKIIGEKLYSEE